MWVPLHKALAQAEKTYLSRALAEAELVTFLDLHPGAWRAKRIEPQQEIDDFWRRDPRHIDWKDCSGHSETLSDHVVGFCIDARVFGIEVEQEPLGQYLSGQLIATKWRPRIKEDDLKKAIGRIAESHVGDKIPFDDLIAELRGPFPYLTRAHARTALKTYAPQLLLSRGKRAA